MQQRILIYGGTALSASLSHFVEELTFSILEHKKITIVTGGFLHFHNNTAAHSTDSSALKGAQRFAIATGIPLNECFETWLPDTMKDRRAEGVERFAKGNVVTLFGESDQARRFAMVKHVDVVVTVSGKINTEMVLDFAFTIDKPALPLPFSGGDSKNYWENKKEKIAESFGLDPETQQQIAQFDVEQASVEERKSIIAKCLSCIDKALVKKPNKEIDIEQNTEALRLEAIGVMKDADEDEMRQANPYTRKRPAVFVSYSHKDAKWKEELDLHIKSLKQSNLIEYWSDNMLIGGDAWDKKIKERIEKADIVLLLVSPEFVNSEYIESIELAIANKNAAAGKSRIIPLFLTKVDIDYSPIRNLQGYPPNGKTISSFPKTRRAEVWYDIVVELKKVITEWQAEAPPTTN